MSQSAVKGQTDFDKISFRNITVEDGLSQSAVFAIEQDKSGYMWFGTADGLNRYDGYDFTHFRHNPSNKHSISDNFILCIEQANDGFLWVGTNGGGLNKYDPQTGQFQRFLADGDKTISSNDVYTVCDFKGKMCVGTANGLNIFDPQTETFKHYLFDDTDEYVVSDFMEMGGVLYLATDYGLRYYNPERDDIYTVMRGDFSVLDGSFIYSIMEANNHEIWVGSDNGLFAFSKEGQLLDYMDRSTDLEQSVITCLLQDSDNNVWIGSNGEGIDIYNAKTNVIHHAHHNPYDNMSVSENAINAIFEDRSGVIWIGTYGGSINKYDKYLNQFELYAHQKGNDKGLNSRLVFSIYEDADNTIWVGTDGGGLNKIARNPKSGREEYTFYKSSQRSSSISSDRVWAIEPDGKDNLYLGTRGGGVNLFNPESASAKQIEYQLPDEYDILKDEVYSLRLQDEKTLWIGSDAGLIIYHTEDKSSSHHMVDTGEYRPFNSNTVLAIMQDSKNRNWVGTFGGGVSWFSEEKGFYRKFRHDRNDSTAISYDKVMCIFEDSKQRIWIGTFGGGLNKFLESNSSFEIITHEDGLPNDVIYGILEDESGNLWLSTNRGICCFNPDSMTFKNYDYSNNLQSDEFNQGAFFKGVSGRFYFGGINGFNAFSPGSMKTNPYKPEVQVTTFGKPGQKLAVSSKAFPVDELRLRYPKNNVFFEFVAFNYVGSSQNEYRYKLEGFDEDWVESGDHRVAAYTNIPSGDYTFKVMASNNDGVWNEVTQNVSLVVTAPFYKQTWFLPVLFLLVLAIIIFITVLVISNVRAKAAQELAETGLRASNAEREGIRNKLVSLRAQMDPHFIFNSLNSIQHFITKNDSKLARQYLTKFADLIRRILNNSREETISLEEELDALKLYIDLERLRFDYSFSYILNIDDGIDAEEEELPTMLIQPYVENAIIHGLKNRADTEGELLIKIRPSGESLIILIEDNGVGREKAKQIRQQKLVKYKSLGMSVTQSRLELWSDTNSPVVQIIDLKDDNNNPLGTRVEIVVKRGYLL